MGDVAIIGAGELGGALAHVLARSDTASAIRLIDDTGRVAEGKALDIAQAAPIDGFATSLAGSTDLSTVAGAALVVIADRVGEGEWQGEDGLMLLTRLTALASSAVILCAGASQRDLVERGVRELHVNRERLFGSAPEALVGAARAIVALELNGSPREVALTVLGVPPAQIVVPWGDVTVGGLVMTSAIDESSRRRVNARLRAMWPPGPYALATAATKVIEAMFGRTRAMASCFVAPDDSAGARTRTIALPVRLGSTGIVQVVVPSLSIGDRVALDNAMML